MTDEPVCPYDQPDNMCWYCTGEDCWQCSAAGTLGRGEVLCDHDVIDRHPR